jgi:alpha-D-ribose 1-methylphosphonate 5-triphosphate synthase subunit PhnG
MSRLDENLARQDWMGLLAQAPAEVLEECSTTFGEMPAFEWLRPPEIGTVMVRGRTGGTGRAFNLGEITVTRCVLQLASGEVGHAAVQGRNKSHATKAALFDALMQGYAAQRVKIHILEPISAALQARKTARAERAAATKVEFFTMVRGED